MSDWEHELKTLLSSRHLDAPGHSYNNGYILLAYCYSFLHACIAFAEDWGESVLYDLSRLSFPSTNRSFLANKYCFRPYQYSHYLTTPFLMFLWKWYYLELHIPQWYQILYQNKISGCNLYVAQLAAGKLIQWRPASPVSSGYAVSRSIISISSAFIVAQLLSGNSNMIFLTSLSVLFGLYIRMQLYVVTPGPMLFY